MSSLLVLLKNFLQIEYLQNNSLYEVHLHGLYSDYYVWDIIVFIQFTNIVIFNKDTTVFNKIFFCVSNKIRFQL